LHFLRLLQRRLEIRIFQRIAVLCAGGQGEKERYDDEDGWQVFRIHAEQDNGLA